MNQAMVARPAVASSVACACDWPRLRRQRTVGSEKADTGGQCSATGVPVEWRSARAWAQETGGVEKSGERASDTLLCGCRVVPGRDRLGRGIGTILERGETCGREDHQPGRVVLLPGREHARPE